MSRQLRQAGRGRGPWEWGKAGGRSVNECHLHAALVLSPDFGPDDYKIILRPNEGYVPKVLSTSFSVQVIMISVFAQNESVVGNTSLLQLLCPVCVYVKRTRWFRLYNSQNVTYPIGVWAHCTRGMASSSSWSCGMSTGNICSTAGWRLKAPLDWCIPLRLGILTELIPFISLCYINWVSTLHSNTVWLDYVPHSFIDGATLRDMILKGNIWLPEFENHKVFNCDVIFFVN